MALGGIVQQRGGEEVAVVLPAPEQPLGDVEAMAAIRDGHRFEEGHAALRQDAVHEGLLLRLDARPYVGDELPDSMHR